MTRQLPLGSCLYSVTVCYYLNITSFFSFSRLWSLSKSATSLFLTLKEESIHLGPPKKMCRFLKVMLIRFSALCIFCTSRIGFISVWCQMIVPLSTKKCHLQRFTRLHNAFFCPRRWSFLFSNKKTKLKLNHGESNFTSYAI